MKKLRKKMSEPTPWKETPEERKARLQGMSLATQITPDKKKKYNRQKYKQFDF